MNNSKAPGGRDRAGKSVAPEIAGKSVTPDRAGKSVALVMLLSTFARCLSLAASVSYTSRFGYTLETDIYSYAVNLPNLIFTCIGTALVTVVIPIFAGRLAKRETDKAYGFIDNIITLSLIIATVIAAAGIAAAPLIIRLIDKFKTGDPSLALYAIRIMFPVMLFHAVGYILQGVLQTNGRYLLPASVSAFSGISVILYVLLLSDRFGVRGLLAATFVGLAAQALVLIPSVAGSLGYRYRYKPSLNLSDVDMRLAGKLALPVLVSSSSYQLNMFVNTTFAASFDGGVLTVTNMLTLAFTAAQLFIISTLSVYFPKMSAHYATGDIKGFHASFNAVMRLILIFAVPASVALAYLSRLLIPLLYGHGAVTEADISASAAVFALYAGAIASIGFKEAADRAFYAVRDSRTPAAVSVLIMALNISLSALLMGRIGIVGLPAAYIIALTTGAILLLAILRVKMKSGEKSGLAPLSVQCALSTTIMIAVLILVELLINAAGGSQYAGGGGLPSGGAGMISGGGLFPGMLLKTAYGLSVGAQIARIAILTVAGCCAYAAAMYALGANEVRIIVNRIVKYKRSRNHGK